MKQSGQCPKCGSKNVVADAKAADRGHGNRDHDLSIVTFANPDAFIFKGKLRTAISAWVCMECGFVELYADAPADLITGRE
ncbi:MAG: hypothetical protein SGJ20_16930 [Planctomycetota bacterium]|nr:hypothetical protein [Planctomycetota bacterium]